MEKNTYGIMAILFILALIGAVAIMGIKERKPRNSLAAEQKQVSQTVESFVKEMKNVPLSGTKEAASDAVSDRYKDYVSLEILEFWANNPIQNAPGRKVSSPWPDHINILSVTKNPDDSYTVTGDVIEVTSKEITGGSETNSYNVTVRLEKRGEQYLITAFQETNPD